MRASRPGVEMAGSTMLIVGAVVAVVGFVIGIVIDLSWPNTVYGYQLVAGVVAIAIGVLGLVVRGVHPLVRPAAAGLAVGVIAGMAVGLSLAPAPAAAQHGSLEVSLDVPQSVELEAASAVCSTADGRLVFLETPNQEGHLPLSDGRRLVIRLSVPPGATGVPTIDVHVISSIDDGSPSDTWLTSGPGSTVSASGTDASGSMAFSALTLHPESEARAAIELAGSLRWTCPSA